MMTKFSNQKQYLQTRAPSEDSDQIVLLTPLNPTFVYIVKLGFTGVYIIFLIYAQKHSRGGSNKYPQSMF